MVVETLLELINNPNGIAHRVILPMELVVRTSCGSSLSD
jgi:DNA-binding LacI/PurR family transcriptional regulator